MLRHARYGPVDRYMTPPPAGMCLSAFALVRRGDSFLIGRARENPNWAARWLFSWANYSQEELLKMYRNRLVPSTYLLEAEHPEDAVKRVMTQQLQMPHYKASLSKVLSYNMPSDWYPGHLHWDLAFAYEVETSDPVKSLPWWKELGYLSRKALRAEEFGWNSDFVVDAGVLKPAKAKGKSS